MPAPGFRDQAFAPVRLRCWRSWARRRSFCASGVSWRSGRRVSPRPSSFSSPPSRPTARSIVSTPWFSTSTRISSRASQRKVRSLVVDIDDDSIAALGQWPWSRTVLATVIDRLAAMGAAAIGLDIIFSEPDRTSPALAVAQFAGQGFTSPIAGPRRRTSITTGCSRRASPRAPVVAGLVLAETAMTTPPPPPKARLRLRRRRPAGLSARLRGQRAQPPDPRRGGARHRRLQLSAGRTASCARSRWSHAMTATSIRRCRSNSLRVAQGASSFIDQEHGRRGELDTGNPGMTALKVGDFEVPTGPDGRIWVYYTRRAAHRRSCRSSRCSAGSDDPELAEPIEGRIVLVGTSAIGLRDLVSTPLKAGCARRARPCRDHRPDRRRHVPHAARTGRSASRSSSAVAACRSSCSPSCPGSRHSPTHWSRRPRLALSIGVGWLAFANYNLLLSPILPAQTRLLAYGVASGVRLLLSESESRYIRRRLQPLSRRRPW